MGISAEEFMAKAKMKLDYSLQPLTAIHLHSNYDGGEFEPNGDIKLYLPFLGRITFYPDPGRYQFHQSFHRTFHFPGQGSGPAQSSWVRSAWT